MIQHHVHYKDHFDCDYDLNKMMQKLVDSGAKGFGAAQHGVLTGVEDLRKAAAAYNMKYIPELEIYVQYDDESEKAHLLLIPKNDKGFRTICKAATESNDKKGMAVINLELLTKYFAEGAEGHGNVIATSACIQGVIAVKLRKNESVEKRIKALVKKQEKYGINPEDKRIEKTETKLSDTDAKIQKNKEEKAELKKIADSKFTTREKQIEKLRSTGAEDYFITQMEEALANDKAAAEKAKADYAELVEKGKALSRKRSMLNKELKELKERTDRWQEEEAQIEELRIQLKTPEELREEARKTALWFKNLFGEGCFYMEMQNHYIEAEKTVYPQLAEIAHELNIPLVATNDVHMVDNSEEELLRRRILQSMRFGTGMEALKEGDTELYLKSETEIREALGQILSEDDVNEAIANTDVIFNQCDVKFEHDNHYPVFPVEEGMTADDLLEKEARAGISWRFPNGFPDDRYAKRLEYELQIIKSMGYSDYHLVVKDYLEYGRELGKVPKKKIEEAPLDIEDLRKWCKDNGWDTGFSIGPGRGSAVGSLVCYLLGITALDPLKYDLLFERFLNPERVSMPDIDSDFSNTIRQKVIQYVEHKYGKNSVCGIMTTNAQAPKGTVRIAAKYYGFDRKNDGRAFLSLADVIAKKIPNEPGMSFSKKDESGKTLYQKLTEEYKSDADALEILRWAKIIEGCSTAYGAHAAGIVISDGTPIRDYIPLRWNDKLSEWTTQMDMVSVEENGFLKMDFLGLKTLDIISDTLVEIKKTHGIKIDPLQIPLDDERVYKDILCAGRTNSVFQFESSGMKNMLQRFEPSCFEDLIILVAMFRPGPLQYLDDVIRVKHGQPVKYITEKLRPLLDKTYGAIVFQEQVMQIFQDLSGYTLGGADQVRRAMSKKKEKVLAAERPVFVHGDEEKHIAGCEKNGIPADAANALFDQMTDFAKYAFNKSHAAAYALIGYYTAWLKLHYPAEFLTGAMNWAEADDIPGLMQEAKKLGVKVLPPDINRSHSGFTVDNGNILFGLGAVKSVGAMADAVIEERKSGGEFKSFAEFFVRVQTKKNAVENLIKADAFECFSENRSAMLAALEPVKKLASKRKDAIEKKKAAEQALLEAGGMSDEESWNYQIESGFCLKGKTPKKQDAFIKLLTSRRDKATENLADINRSLQEFRIDESIAEDKSTHLVMEKEFLGAYVTGHPLDQYPDAEAIGLKPIMDVTEGEAKIFGMIHDIEIKLRKKDGAEMAFFTIEDQTGELSVSAFTAQYARLRDKIKDGAVVILRGRVVMEERNDDLIPKFYVEDIEPAKKKEEKLVLPVKCFYTFIAEKGAAFKRQYEDTNGHPFYIFDTLLGQMRKMKYRVSGEVLSLPGAKMM